MHISSCTQLRLLKSGQLVLCRRRLEASGFASHAIVVQSLPTVRAMETSTRDHAQAATALPMAASKAASNMLPSAPTPLAASTPSSTPTGPTTATNTRYPYPLSTLVTALSIPPSLDRQVGAHVVHLLVHREGPGSEVLAELLGLPQDLMLRLIWFGAVYYCPVPPLTQQQQQQQQHRQQQQQQRKRHQQQQQQQQQKQVREGGREQRAQRAAAAVGPSHVGTDDAADAPSLPRVKPQKQQQRMESIPGQPQTQPQQQDTTRAAALARW
ncbi:hypothetical protein Agub_g14808, partial [Astrephomene gubernaculifera]